MHPQKSQFPNDLFGVVPLIAEVLSPVSRGDRTFAALAKRLSNVRRGMARVARNWLDRLDHWLWALQQRDVEAYLAKAIDVYDLEARVRMLERNVPHPYY